MATETQRRAINLLDTLAELIEYCHDEGGPTPLRDALERWHEDWPWQERRPVERELSMGAVRALRSAMDEASRG